MGVLITSVDLFYTLTWVQYPGFLKPRRPGLIHMTLVQLKCHERHHTAVGTMHTHIASVPWLYKFTDSELYYVASPTIFCGGMRF